MEAFKKPEIPVRNLPYLILSPKYIHLSSSETSVPFLKFCIPFLNLGLHFFYLLPPSLFHLPKFFKQLAVLEESQLKIPIQFTRKSFDRSVFSPHLVYLTKEIQVDSHVSLQ